MGLGRDREGTEVVQVHGNDEKEEMSVWKGFVERHSVKKKSVERKHQEQVLFFSFDMGFIFMNS